MTTAITGTSTPLTTTPACRSNESSDLLGDYLKSIGQVSLLSADDEISLGHRVQAMLRIREERPEEDWTKQERRTVRSGDRAKKKMIECNLRLVVSCAKKVCRS